MSDDNWRDYSPINSQYEVQINTRTGKFRHRPLLVPRERADLFGPRLTADTDWIPGWPGKGVQG